MSDWRLPAVTERAASGPFDDPIQDNNGAELFAAVFWLLHLDPVARHVCLWSDSSVLVDGYSAIEVMCQPYTPFVHLWRRIRHMIADMGRKPEVVWCKGHATVSQTEGIPVLAYQREGNHRADALAKLALQRCDVSVCRQGSDHSHLQSRHLARQALCPSPGVAEAP